MSNCPQWFIDQCHAGGYDVSVTLTECICGDTPIIIKPSGGEMQLSSAAEGVLFDLRAIGVPKRYAWPERDSGIGFLALDRNNNGYVDDGSELFSAVTPHSASTVTPNGFLALAEFDKPENGGNADGRINDKDSVFAKLVIWEDRNRNGISELNELTPLRSVGIRSISLAYRLSEKRDMNGNLFRYRSKIEFDASPSSDTGWAWDVILGADFDPPISAHSLNTNVHSVTMARSQSLGQGD